MRKENGDALSVTQESGYGIKRKRNMSDTKPTWANLYICNCVYGWNNCKCDGETGKKIR